MRKQFVKTVENVLENNKNTTLFLGDIGVFGFRNTFEKYPNRVYNIGILEQATVGLAAGLSMAGMIPIVHTIAPFMVERSYEQLKIDFGYQKLGGNFISIGNSYDYSALGCTHQCPADINILKQIPGFEICVPGTSKEFDTLFNQSYNNNNPTYYRLSEHENNIDIDVEFGKANVIKKGNLATVIVAGNLLGKVLESCKDLDVTILYYTTLSPFDYDTLKNNCGSGKILLCEPYYSGGLTYDIISGLYPKPIILDYIGVQHEFSEYYGTFEEHNQENGITIENIKTKLEKLINV